MTKLILLFLLVLVPILSVVGQSVEYEKYIVDVFGIESESIIYCMDGNYLLSGKIYEGEDSINVNYYITKIDQLGNVLNSHIYRDTVDSHLKSSIETTEGSFFFTGFSYYGDSIKYTTLKIDNNGDSLWMKIHGQGKSNLPHKIIETQDNNLVIVGSTKIDGGTRKASMLKLDKEGTTIWEKIIGESTSENIALDVIELSNGNLITSGWWSNGNSKGYLISTDNTGNVLWEKKLSPSIQEIFTDLELGTDGTILVGGFRETTNYKRSPILFKIDIDGNIIWEKVYQNMDVDTWGSEIDQDIDNNIFLTGSSQKDGSQKIWLLKLDSNGDEIYNNFYGDDQSNWVSALSTLEDNSLGLLTNSMILNNTTGDLNRAFYFIKIKDLNTTQNNEIDHLYKIKLYPNPSYLYVDIELPPNENIEVLSIHNNIGQNVQSLSFINQNQTRINLESTPPGIYWVSILTNQHNVFTEKLIVR